MTGAPKGNGRKSELVDLERDGLAIHAEYLQTDPWAIDAILRAEILTKRVVDPCCGDGRMALAAERAGYHKTYASDLYDWGHAPAGRMDFLSTNHGVIEFLRGIVVESTVFMNPPFSLACEFVDRAFELGARKVVCFQRSVWRESIDRREWWERNPPNRIYQCGNRAVCWYGTIPMNLRKGGANQPHSWFVWEKGNPPGTLLGTIWRDSK